MKKRSAVVTATCVLLVAGVPLAARQAAITRDPGERVVIVSLTLQGTAVAVPSALASRAAPLLVFDDEYVVVRNPSATERLALLFYDDRNMLIGDDPVVVEPMRETGLPPDVLSRYAGVDRQLRIEVVAAAVPTKRVGDMYLAIDARPPDAERERAATQQIDAAQAALRPTAGSVGVAVGAPYGVDISGTKPPQAVATATRPLQLDQQDLHLMLPPGERRFVRFITDFGRTRTPPGVQPVTGPAGLTIPYQDLADWAGRDNHLAFEVQDVNGRALWRGHLNFDILPPSGGQLTIPLDLTGIADWRFLNPRRPVRIGPLDEGDAGAELVFSNEVPGRTMKVSFPRVAAALAPQFEDEGFDVDCSRQTSCVPELALLHGAPHSVAARLLVTAYTGSATGVVEFKVAFFEGDLEPAYASGFVSVVRRPIEPEFAASWSALANAGVVRDAHFAAFTMESEAPVINATTPFSDQHRWHVTGAARLGTRLLLGTRASAEVDLLVKDKDFGANDAPTVTAPKIRIGVFGINGFSLAAGRFDMAAPTRSIAISESGEGMSARWRRYSVSHVARPREKADQGVIPVPKHAPPLVPALPDVRQRWSTLAQASWTPKRVRIEASSLIGHRRTLRGGNGRYYTWGTDVLIANGFTAPTASPLSRTALLAHRQYAWKVNGGVYGSYREAEASDVDAPDGDHGWAGLVDASITRLHGRTPRFTIVGTLAMATRDDPDTKHSEGYVGESGAFGPDKIFLATLAPKFGALMLAEADAGQQARYIRGGLTGKSYGGASFAWNGFSPLEWIVWLAGVPRSDLGVSATTLRWHGYALRQEVTRQTNAAARTWLGQEGSMEWLVESPRGVRYTMTVAGFRPGALLREQPMVPVSTWFLDARVTFTLR